MQDYTNFNCAIENKIVNKEEFCLKLLSPHDLVIDNQAKVIAVFPSTNTNFKFHGNYTQYEVTCRYCNYCENCIDCYDCSFCNNCKKCNTCYYCRDCTNCIACSHCELCQNTNTSVFIQSSENIKSCFFNQYCSDNVDCRFTYYSNHNQNCNYLNDCNDNKYCGYMYNSHKNNTCSYICNSNENKVTNYSCSVNNNYKCDFLRYSDDNKLCMYLDRSTYNNQCSYGFLLTSCVNCEFIRRSKKSEICNYCEGMFSCLHCKHSIECVKCIYSDKLDTCTLCDNCKFLNACDNCNCVNFAFDTSYCHDCTYMNSCNLCKSCKSLSNSQLCVNTNFSTQMFVSKNTKLSDNSMFIQDSTMCNNINTLMKLQELYEQFNIDKHTFITRIYNDQELPVKILKDPNPSLIKINNSNNNITSWIDIYIDNILLQSNMTSMLTKFVLPRFIELYNELKSYANILCKQCNHCNNLLACNNCEFVSFANNASNCRYCTILDKCNEIEYTTLRLNNIQYIIQNTNINQINTTTVINSVKLQKQVKIYDCECGCGRRVEVVLSSPELQIYICYNEDNEVVYIGSNHVGIILYNYFSQCEINGKAMVYEINFYNFIDPLLYLNHKNNFDDSEKQVINKFDRNGEAC